MKKIMFCIIIGILLLNSIIATGMIEDNISKDDSSTIISVGQEGEYIPTVFDCHLEADSSGRFDCSLTGYDLEINDWTQKQQKVRINWSYDSEYDGTIEVKLRARFREWGGPLSVLIFFLFSSYGKILTPGYKRFVPINISVNLGSDSGHEEINIEIDEDEDYQEMAGFIYMIHPKMNGFFNFEWCGADINI